DGYAAVHATFCADERTPPAATGPDWPQLQGSPRHLGATPTEIAPPLRAIWARALGAHLRGGSPVLSGGRLFVPLVDPAGGFGGGLVALDAATGATLWQWRGGRNVDNAPAVAGDIVVAAAENGVVHAFDAATGHERWQVNVAHDKPQIASLLFSSPTIVDGVA